MEAPFPRFTICGKSIYFSLYPSLNFCYNKMLLYKSLREMRT